MVNICNGTSIRFILTDYRKKAEEESKKHEDLKQKHEVDEREKKLVEGTTESQVEESNISGPNM